MSSLFRCNLVKKNCGDFCLENVSFNLEPGYIMGVIGENGVGKTTLLRCILGSYHLTGDGNEGSMELMGKDQTKDMPEYKGKIGYVLQDSPFNHLMTAKEVGRVYGRYYDGFDMAKYESLLRKYEVPFEEKEKYRSLHQNSIDESLRVSARITETNKEELICIDGVEKGKIPEEILQYSRYADLKEIMYYVEKAEEGE